VWQHFFQVKFSIPICVTQVHPLWGPSSLTHICNHSFHISSKCKRLSTWDFLRKYCNIWNVMSIILLFLRYRCKHINMHFELYVYPKTKDTHIRHISVSRFWWKFMSDITLMPMSTTYSIKYQWSDYRKENPQESGGQFSRYQLRFSLLVFHIPSEFLASWYNATYGLYVSGTFVHSEAHLYINMNHSLKNR